MRSYRNDTIWPSDICHIGRETQTQPNASAPCSGLPSLHCRLIVRDCIGRERMHALHRQHLAWRHLFSRPWHDTSAVHTQLGPRTPCSPRAAVDSPGCSALCICGIRAALQVDPRGRHPAPNALPSMPSSSAPRKARRDACKQGSVSVQRDAARPWNKG
jgi:hypothetical protein